MRGITWMRACEYTLHLLVKDGWRFHPACIFGTVLYKEIYTLQLCCRASQVTNKPDFTTTSMYVYAPDVSGRSTKKKKGGRILFDY
jgi:hypothetical protein